MRRIPLFPLDVVLFPGGDLPLHIFEPRYRKMVARCLEESIGFGVVRSSQGRLEGIGCEALAIRVLHRYPDGRLDIAVRGGARLSIERPQEHPDGYLEASVRPVQDRPEEPDPALEDRVEVLYRRLAGMGGDLSADPPPRGPRWSYRIAEKLSFGADVRQGILAAEGENERLGRLVVEMTRAIPRLQKRQRLRKLVKGNGRAHRLAKGGEP